MVHQRTTLPISLPQKGLSVRVDSPATATATVGDQQPCVPSLLALKSISTTCAPCTRPDRGGRRRQSTRASATSRLPLQTCMGSKFQLDPASLDSGPRPVPIIHTLGIHRTHVVPTNPVLVAASSVSCP